MGGMREDPVSLSFAGLLSAERLISGQSLGMTVWGPVCGGEGGTHLHTVCHILEVPGSTPLQLF